MSGDVQQGRPGTTEAQNPSGGILQQLCRTSPQHRPGLVRWAPLPRARTGRAAHFGSRTRGCAAPPPRSVSSRARRATGRLLKLAAYRAASPADFHLVSTLSVCGRAPEDGFRLFTEYDEVPEALDENYYIRSKQEAERLVVAARGYLANASIHRVGNVVFAAEGALLQLNIGENAFFRQIAAFLRLGVAPDDS